MDEPSLDSFHDNINSRLVQLIRLMPTDPRFLEIDRLFYKGWKHPEKTQPHLYAVYKFVLPQSILQPYLEYKSSLSKLLDARKSSRRGTPEQLLFHGTTRACLLGENPHNILLCSLPECSLCAIIRGSFDINHCGRRNHFNRFGTGIYTSACTSKADDYVSNLSTKAALRVLLLNSVAVGRPKKMRLNAVNLTAPPPGYDSVVGEPGADLNYEETVVYSNDAVRPSFLLVYGEPAPQLSNKFAATLRQLFTTPLA